jgi:hypothetical protein
MLALAALETRCFCDRPEKITQKPPVRDAGGNLIYYFLTPSRMTEILQVEGGIRAPRVGLGDFALNPQNKNTSSKWQSFLPK